MDGPEARGLRLGWVERVCNGDCRGEGDVVRRDVVRGEGDVVGGVEVLRCDFEGEGEAEEVVHGGDDGAAILDGEGARLGKGIGVSIEEFRELVLSVGCTWGSRAGGM